VYIGKYSCTAAIAAARSIAGAQWLDKGWRADKWLVNEKEGRAWRAAACRHDGRPAAGTLQGHHGIDGTRAAAAHTHPW